MTTTSIAGIDFPDDLLAECDEVRQRLDVLMPDLMALLDRLSGVYSAMRLIENDATEWDPSDELTEYMKSHTSLARSADRALLHYRQPSRPRRRWTHDRRIRQGQPRVPGFAGVACPRGRGRAPASGVPGTSRS